MTSKKPLSKAKPHTSQRQPASTDLATAPTILNALPDVDGDDQKTVLPLSAQTDGVQVSFPRWSPLADEFDLDSDIWTVYVDGRPVLIGSYADGDPLPPDPFLPPPFMHNSLRTHGEKRITYQIQHASGNVAPSDETLVFVDLIDPNLNNAPPAITLPADLAGPVTPAYLEGKVGLACLIPVLADIRPGDTWRAWFGAADEVGISGVFPATGPASVIFPTASILNHGEGDHAIIYTVNDRSGNATQFSFPRTVTVLVTSPPVPGTLEVLEAPLIDKEEARNGVTVVLSGIEQYLSTDVVRLFWHGVLVEERPIGPFPIFPFEFRVTYPFIANPGTEYTADVHCTITRASGSVPSDTINVEVNLTEPGIGNPGPGPVDPALERPTLRGNEGHENRLVEADRNFPATATFPLPPSLGPGDFVDVFYGYMGGTLGATYPVTGLEAPGFEVSLPVPWAVIEPYGNGHDIPCFLRVRNDINYKLSPVQPITVEIFSLSGLAAPKFNLLSAQGTLNCFNFATPPLSPAPWEGVPIRIKDDVTLEVGDRVVIHAARYAISDSTTPIGTPVETTEREISFNDIQEGFVVTLDLASWFRDFSVNLGRGQVGVSWSVFRPSTGDRGTSDEVQVRWDFRGSYPQGTCVPGSTRASGTL